MLINGLTAWLFMKGSKDDLNIRGAFLHMGADALVSAGVVVAGGLYLWQGWDWLDPIISLLIALIILIGTWSLFRRSLHLMFDGVPDSIDLPAVAARLQALEGVEAIHDLHIWALSTTENAITAHLVVAPGQDRDQLLRRASELLAGSGLKHATLQLESADFARRCLSGRCGSRASISLSTGTRRR